MATNPVDVMTRLALELTGWPPGRVIGSGTTLDTARLRHQLGLHFGIDPRNIHAYIVGEHGDTEVPVWSSASIAGVPLEDACKLLGIACSPEGMAALRKKVYRSTRDAAFEIIDRKGATSYGIATALVRIAAAILRDEKTILTVSSFQGPIHGLGDICLSLPSVIGRDGRERVIEQPLEVAELSLLRQSAERIIAVYERLE
jgi:L-lactate dehydrogenase